MTSLLREHLGSMSAEDSISALVKSRESRTTLLKLSSDLGSADNPKLRDALREDELRLAAHIPAILESESSESILLRERDHKSKARRIILKLSEACDKLPSSLFISGVTGCDEHATFGGGFGDIYQASYAGKTVALKLVRTFHGQETRLKFCREALVWQDLQHPYILPLIGIDRESFPATSLCMVSPWMEHGTALRYLNDHGRANVDRLLSEIAQGLEHLHSRDIVHGDLRGVNILINDQWRACLADFGLTSFSDATTTALSSNRAGSLYTGRPPFPDIPEPAAMLRVIDGGRPLKPSCDPAISDALWQCLNECWTEDSAARPATHVVVQHMQLNYMDIQTRCSHPNTSYLPGF
ncbi:kinase-like domain-containing protein [Mycena rebaudengoi]|nr:kinase-like domain-containing protein [Mycena rebaudengoi]